MSDVLKYKKYTCKGATNVKKTLIWLLCAVILCTALCGCSQESVSRSVSGSDSADISGADIPAFSESDIDYSDYVVAQETGLEYAPWEACEGSYAAFAREKLLYIAQKAVSLCQYESSLKGCRNPEEMLADTGFCRLLNDLRAFSFGASSYPEETLNSEGEREICRALSSLGNDCADFAARLPSLVLCENDEAMAEYENSVLGQIAEMQKMLANLT